MMNRRHPSDGTSLPRTGPLDSDGGTPTQANSFSMGCIITVVIVSSASSLLWSFDFVNGMVSSHRGTRRQAKASNATTFSASPEVETRATVSPGGPHGCEQPSGNSAEIAFNGILYGLFREGLVPPGDIFDCGAFDGKTGCFFACAGGPDRIVRSVDPSPGNVAGYSCNRNNFRGYAGAIGDVDGTLASKKDRKGMITVDFSKVHGIQEAGVSAENSVPMWRIDRWMDSVFANESLSSGSGVPRLGLAHLDVEGSELRALKGAEKTIMKDRPFFTVEMHVHKDYKTNVEMLEYITQKLGYRAYIVEEVCGAWVDCRNLICFPNEVVGDLRNSPTLDLASYSGLIKPVDATTLEYHAYADCCRAGGECNRRPGQVCSTAMLSQWRKKKEGQFFGNPINYTVNMWREGKRFG